MNYLSSQEILYIHSRVVDELGGKHGINDIAVLKKLVKYLHNAEIFPDKFSKAAALFFGIAKKRLFAGKNLATGITILQIFLNINKLNIDVASKRFQDFIDEELPLAKLEDIRKFLIQNTQTLS